MIVSLVKLVPGSEVMDHRRYRYYEEIVDTLNERYCHGRMSFVSVTSGDIVATYGWNVEDSYK